jgi:hypothetical protein
MSHNAKYGLTRTNCDTEEAGMLADLEALTPPLIVGGAFLIGVVWFLRRQMSPRRAAEDEGDEPDIGADGRNDDLGDPAHGSPADQHKV